jgi:hypothetical protein
MGKVTEAALTDTSGQRKQWTVVRIGWFLWHLLQMVLAMIVGMAIYIALVRLSLAADGYRAMQIEQPLLWYSEMALFMTVPMVALMRRQGHRWRQCTAMSAAMVIPPIGLIALVQLGVTAHLPWLSSRTLPESTHIAMLLGMLVFMVHHRDEYGDRMQHRSWSVPSDVDQG